MLSIPSKYLFLCVRRRFGFNKKICTIQNYLLFTCISNLILAIHMQSMNGLEELSKTVEKSSSSPRSVGVFL